MEMNSILRQPLSSKWESVPFVVYLHFAEIEFSRRHFETIPLQLSEAIAKIEQKEGKENVF